MSKRTRGDLKFVLPKKGSTTVSLPREDSAKETKIIDLQIDDFMMKLKGAVQNLSMKLVDECADFIKSPRFIIGDQGVFVRLWINEYDIVNLDIVNDEGVDHLMSMLLTGSCGNLTLEKRDEWKKGRKGLDSLGVMLGSTDKLEKAMTNSGNLKLDLQLTVTALVTGESGDDQWIIPRYVFGLNSLKIYYSC